VHSADTLLSRGLRALRASDRELDRLIAPRHDAVISGLTKYIGEIRLFNPLYGLVGTEDPGEIVVRHILDSLAPAGILYRLLKGSAPDAQIADVGSGAGLPGIPLAIVFPK
jgi:16S rRNA (guanine527-N7)-methyltransferase